MGTGIPILQMRTLRPRMSWAVCPPSLPSLCSWGGSGCLPKTRLVRRAVGTVIKVPGTFVVQSGAWKREELALWGAEGGA